LAAEHITPQLATSTANMTSNVASPCRTPYATQILRLPGAHTPILRSSDRQHKDVGDVQGGADSAPLTQRSYPRLGPSGKHPRSTVCCSQQHSVTSCHATASPQPGQSPCSRICKPNHSCHVQTLRLAPLYKIRLSALLRCAACIAKCSMCQRSMLPLQESEE
jgi:hypothetical protein